MNKLEKEMEKERAMSILVQQVISHNYNDVFEFYEDVKYRSIKYDKHAVILRVYLYKKWPHDNYIINFIDKTFIFSDNNNFKENITFTLNEVIIHERQYKLADLLTN